MRNPAVLSITKLLLGGLALLVLSGCQNTHTSNPLSCDSSQNRNTGTPAEKKLNYGVLSFEEGNYQAAIPALQGVLDTSLSGKGERVMAYKYLAFINYQAAIPALQGVLDTSLSGKGERVMAYKYLAFIQCVSGHELTCRDYFKKALDTDPNFNLDTAEAGHPIWGPVFRSVKGKLSK
jgi:hypothetical protein